MLRPNLFVVILRGIIEPIDPYALLATAQHGRVIEAQYLCETRDFMLRNSYYLPN